ncbi:MAG: NUDIX hydrolase [Patescibacteria group bacterium]
MLKTCGVDILGMSKSWKKISSEVIHQNPYFNYKHDVFETSKGIKGDYYYLADHNSVFIIPVLDDGRLVLINTYRYLFNKYGIEFPGGGVKKGQTFEQAAREELVEETGFEAREFINIGEFAPLNGLSTEVCRVFLARGLVKGKAKPEPTEEHEVIMRRIDEFEDHIKRNEITDGLTLSAWVLARHHLVQES